MARSRTATRAAAAGRKFRVFGGGGEDGGRRGDFAGMEEEGVAAFGDIGEERFGDAVLFEVLLELFAELRGLDADEGVLAGVVVFRTAKDTDTDVVLAEVGGAVGEGVFADEQKEFTEAVGLLKGRAAGDAFQQFAAGVDRTGRRVRGVKGRL
jgi:hypothetical protein